MDLSLIWTIGLFNPRLQLHVSGQDDDKGGVDQVQGVPTFMAMKLTLKSLNGWMPQPPDARVRPPRATRQRPGFVQHARRKHDARFLFYFKEGQEIMLEEGECKSYRSFVI